MPVEMMVALLVIAMVIAVIAVTTMVADAKVHKIAFFFKLIDSTLLFQRTLGANASFLLLLLVIYCTYDLFK